MTDLNLSEVYKPNKMQEALHKSPAKYVCLWGGADSGKSWGAIIEGLLLMHDFPNNEGLVLRYSYTELRDYSIPKYIEFAQKLNIFIDYRVFDKELIIRTIDPERNSVIKFRATAERGAKAEQSSKFGSTEIGFFHIEEAQDPRIKETVWHMLIKRLRRKDNMPIRPFCRGILTCNPPSPEHWLDRIFWTIREEPNGMKDDMQILTTKTTDNIDLATGKPLYNEENLQSLLKQFSPAWKQVYIEGKPAFIPIGHPVWTNFDWSLNAGEFEPQKNHKIIRIWDFGRRRSCVLFAQMIRVRNENIHGLQQVRPPLDRVTFLRELIYEGKTTYRMAEEAIAYSNSEFFGYSFDDIGDFAGKQKKAEADKSSFDILRWYNINIKGRPMQGIREKCIEIIEEKLQQKVSGIPLIEVDEKRCPVLTEAFAGSWTRDDNGDPTEDNYYEHVSDCAIYLFANFMLDGQRPSTPIKINVPVYGNNRKNDRKVVAK